MSRAHAPFAFADDFEATREWRRFDPTDFERTQVLPRVVSIPATRANPSCVARASRALRLFGARHFSWRPRLGAPVVFFVVALIAFAAAVGFLCGARSHGGVQSGAVVSNDVR